MKTIGVLGGMSAQATMDFEARVHRLAQRLVPQAWNTARLGRSVDVIVIPCNAAHVGLPEIRAAAGRPVLSMIDAALGEVGRRGWRRVGVLGFRIAPALYVEPLRERGARCEAIDAAPRRWTAWCSAARRFRCCCARTPRPGTSSTRPRCWPRPRSASPLGRRRPVEAGRPRAGRRRSPRTSRFFSALTWHRRCVERWS